MQGVIDGINKMKSRGLKKEQLEELALAEKLVAWMEVGHALGKQGLGKGWELE